MCEYILALHKGHFLIFKKIQIIMSKTIIIYITFYKVKIQCEFYLLYIQPGISRAKQVLFFFLFSFLLLKLEYFLLIKNHLTEKKKKKCLQLSFGNEFSYYMHINSPSKGGIPISRLLLKLQFSSYLCQNCLVCLNCPEKKYAKEALKKENFLLFNSYVPPENFFKHIYFKNLWGNLHFILSCCKQQI